MRLGGKKSLPFFSESRIHDETKFGVGGGEPQDLIDVQRSAFWWLGLDFCTFPFIV